jgi:hypothetical protein
MQQRTLLGGILFNDAGDGLHVTRPPLSPPAAALGGLGGSAALR